MICPACSTKFGQRTMYLKDGCFECGCGYSIIKKSSATPKIESKSVKSGIVKPI
jgi:predicted  nucleic acid-binding Zn-ribbon protein